MARQIYKYLLKQDYIDDDDRISPAYHEAKAAGTLAELPAELAPHAEQVFALIDSVFSEAQLPTPDDDRRAKSNPLNANFKKQEFKALWERINRKAAYIVAFDSDELTAKCITALSQHLTVTKLRYRLESGEQRDDTDAEALRRGEGFKGSETKGETYRGSIQSRVHYDLIGRIAAETQLTRRTIGTILQGLAPEVFGQYSLNPEDFIQKAATLIKEQKATLIVEHLSYDPLEDRHGLDIFTRAKAPQDFSSAVRAGRHVFDYVLTDSAGEQAFVEQLDTCTDVVVYAKLPKGFAIPTPVGDYNPDWAIAFREGAVKHIYFVAETKGSMSSLQLREIEQRKIDGARRFFSRIAPDQVRYDVVDGYDKLLTLVQ